MLDGFVNNFLCKNTKTGIKNEKISRFLLFSPKYFVDDLLYFAIVSQRREEFWSINRFYPLFL